MASIFVMYAARVCLAPTAARVATTHVEAALVTTKVGTIFLMTRGRGGKSRKATSNHVRETALWVSDVSGL